MKTLRNNTREIKIGNIKIGGGNDIIIQSMTNTDTRDVAATVAQINALETEGCELVRVAVLDMEAAECIYKIKEKISIPLIADIHFDYRLALKALEMGVDKLRINPGNIGEGSKEVALAAKKRGVPIRVGVNSGSLDKDILAKHGSVTAEGLVESAKRQIEILEALDFNDIIISLKDSDVRRSVAAFRLISEMYDYPLHIGITEAGTPYTGTIKSAMGIGSLLIDGIGDTLRVSLTGSPLEEIRPAKEILKCLKLRQFGPEIISCPTCGRTQVNLIELANRVEERLHNMDKPITVAVMGCVVNGPGEASQADIGIACGKQSGVIFKKGQRLRTVNENELLTELMKEIDNYEF